MAKDIKFFSRCTCKHDAWCGYFWQIPLKVTLGPKGRNVVLKNQFGSPLITNMV